MGRAPPPWGACSPGPLHRWTRSFLSKLNSPPEAAPLLQKCAAGCCEAADGQGSRVSCLDRGFSRAPALFQSGLSPIRHASESGTVGDCELVDVPRATREVGDLMKNRTLASLWSAQGDVGSTINIRKITYTCDG